MRRTNARFRYTGLWVSVALAISATSLSSVAYAGPGVWTSGGPYGGNVLALAINPTTPAMLYAGTYGGGVFKSTDSGGTWAAANTGLTTLNVKYISAGVAPPETLMRAEVRVVDQAKLDLLHQAFRRQRPQQA